MESPSDQRHFHCDHCNGRIAIPFDLPVTIAPCPHCQMTITSPPPPQAPGVGAPVPAPRPKPALSENSGWVKAWSPPLGQNTGRVAPLSPLGQNSGRVAVASPLGQSTGRVVANAPLGQNTVRVVAPGKTSRVTPSPPAPLDAGRSSGPAPLTQGRVAPVGAPGEAGRAIAAPMLNRVAPAVAEQPASVNPLKPLEEGNRVRASAPVVAAATAETAPGGKPLVAVQVNDEEASQVKLNPLSLWLATARVKLIAPKKETVAPPAEAGAGGQPHVGPSIAVRGVEQEVDLRPQTRLGQDTMLVRARLERFNQVPVKPISSSVTVAPEGAQPAAAAAEERTDRNKRSGKRKLIFALAAAVPVLLAVAGFGYLKFGKEEETALVIPGKMGMTGPGKVRTKRTPEEEFLAGGWHQSARTTLAGFLAAGSVEARMPLVVADSKLAARMENFYADASHATAGVAAEAFRPVDLSDADRQRGLFLMVYNKPVEGGDPERALAFFKRVDDKLLLDWDTFVQTRFRTFKRFLDVPEAGALGVFRVMVAPDAQQAGGAKTFKLVLADPAYPQDKVTLEVEADSALGMELAKGAFKSAADGKPVPRTATIELGWDAGKKLKVSEFVCWEFLGLGSDALQVQR